MFSSIFHLNQLVRTLVHLYIFLSCFIVLFSLLFHLEQLVHTLVLLYIFVYIF